MTDTTPPVDPTEGATPEQSNNPNPGSAPSATPPAPPAPPAAPVGQPTPQQVAPQAPMNTLSIVAFIASFFISLAGIIMGHIALGQVKKTGERGRGFALAGTIIGYVSLVATILVLILTFVFAGLAVSAANNAASELEQSSQELQSELESDAPSTDEASGDRSPEFCDAVNAASTVGNETNDDGTLNDAALAAFETLASTPSPNQAVYQRFAKIAADPLELQNDESPDTLVSDFTEAFTEDSLACM